jgi:hypothetical protein
MPIKHASRQHCTTHTLEIASTAARHVSLARCLHKLEIAVILEWCRWLAGLSEICSTKRLASSTSAGHRRHRHPGKVRLLVLGSNNNSSNNSWSDQQQHATLGRLVRYIRATGVPDDGVGVGDVAGVEQVDDGAQSLSLKCCGVDAHDNSNATTCLHCPSDPIGHAQSVALQSRLPIGKGFAYNTV